MEEFSSPADDLGADRAARPEFEAQHGYAPDTRASGKLRQWANHATRLSKAGEPLDLAAQARRWAEQARSREAGALEPVMPGVTSRRAPARRQREPRAIWELTQSRTAS